MIKLQGKNNRTQLNLWIVFLSNGNVHCNFDSFFIVILLKVTEMINQFFVLNDVSNKKKYINNFSVHKTIIN